MISTGDSPNSPKYYCKKCMETCKEKIYVGHEASRVTKQFKEKRRKEELKPEQLRIPEVTIRASEQSYRLTCAQLNYHQDFLVRVFDHFACHSIRSTSLAQINSFRSVRPIQIKLSHF